MHCFLKFLAEIARRYARAGPTGRSSRPPGPNSPLCRASRRGSCGETTPCFVLQRLLRPNGQIRYLGPELTHVITYKAYDLIVSVVLCAYRSCGAIARAIATATQHLVRRAIPPWLTCERLRTPLALRAIAFPYIVPLPGLCRATLGSIPRLCHQSRFVD